MSRSDLDETVRDMWATRPHRLRSDRKIAGVAAAVGRRYRIDPVLVRVAFVVTTFFGGIGVVLYVLGWLLLPADGDEVSGAEALVGHGRSGMSKQLAVVLMLVLAIAVIGSGLFDADISALLSAAGVAAALYLLHKHRGGPPGGAAAGPGASAGRPGDPATATAGWPGTPPEANDATGTPTTGGPGTRVPGAGGPGAGGPGAGEPEGGARRADPATPPAWDPLGVAPFAWDLPEPAPAGPPAPPPARRRSPVTAVTLALALITGGAAAIVAMSSSGVGAAEVAALTLAVVGGGLVIGAFARGGRGLIAVAIPLALVTYALAVLPISRFGPQHGVGERTWQPSAVADLQGFYRLSAGEATLDLRELSLTGTDDLRTVVQLGTGSLTVLLPAGTADVEVRCEAGVGELSCLDGQDSGFGPELDGMDLGSDGQAGGGRLVVTASVGAGELAVTR